MWWYSQDEERFNGPCSDREEAIAEGRCNYDGEGFMIVEADQGDYHIEVTGGDMLELLDGKNDDRGDPDGDPPFYSVTDKQAADLAAMVNSAIKRWVHKHRIDVRAWAFENRGKIENIEPLTAPAEAEAASQ